MWFEKIEECAEWSTAIQRELGCTEPAGSDELHGAATTEV
jgi:hypothetical protein